MKTKVRNRPERAPAHEVAKALKRIKEYRDAGKHKEIGAAIAAEAISPSALNAWLNAPDRVRFATKAPYLVKAAKRLPPLRQAKKFTAYRLLLEELGLPSNHSDELSQLGRTYDLLLRSEMKGLQLGGQFIIDTNSHGVVIFWARYESNGHYRTFDGLVVQRNNLIHLIGLSEQNMFIGNLHKVKDPSKEVMYGTFAYEEMAGVGYTRFGLNPDGHEMTDREKAYAEKTLKMPIE